MKSAIVMVLLTLSFFLYSWLSADEAVDFSSDVKPILNSKCISCHGGVTAKGGFSLLFREEALATTKSGKPAIIPGDPAASEMIRRINHSDPEERMPYQHEPLEKKEIRILTKWIKQGAKWGEHWAYVPVRKVETPDIKDSWIRNDVDRFVLEKLKKEKIDPSAEADKPTLLRRVSMDLIGTYPSSEIAYQYLKEEDDQAYEVLVDSLLSSPRFGEKWASMWLDLARYADTKGYESDHERSIWQYRDWVIKVFNRDKPYNQFLTEQIAGDLLPDPSDNDYIATAFHRNTMTNDEAGTDNEEYRTIAVIDRVNTTWEALMSTTFACVQCHSHPYDPFRHEEYYRFLAYFNNTRDEDQPLEFPLLREFNEEQQQQMQKVVDWVREHVGASKAHTIKGFLRTKQPAINATAAEALANATMNFNFGFLVRNHAVFKLNGVSLDGNNLLVFTYSANHPGGVLTMRLDSPDSPVFASVNIPATLNSTQWGKAENGYMYVALPAKGGVHDIYFSYRNSSMPDSREEVGMRFTWFSFLPFPETKAPEYAVHNRLFRQLVEAQTPTVPIMVENIPSLRRQTKVFERGNMKTLGKEVSPGVPESLNAAMPGDAPKNRLGLTMWLTDKRNPLVSRTLVNRIWEQLFGVGIVETLEDMGTQGLKPTHKDLLDHYSFRFMNDLGWSIKKLLKELVMSATYRQESKLTEELKERDLYNRFYARGPRIRLGAEQLRDQHLFIGGVLSDKMYGPPVMPWQPEGIWNAPYNREKWMPSEGEDQYRRAIYTYWKRSSPYPSMMSFDAPQRVVCVARRIRTNTPLQALVTLNDSVFVDISRQFAFRMKREGGTDIQNQISKGYEIMLYKPIEEKDLSGLLKLYYNVLKEFQRDNEAVWDIIGYYDEHRNAETAALVIVANAMLNLDEILMKN